jgi:pimeloyl-ACP methyl ester carboxylesterase
MAFGSRIRPVLRATRVPLGLGLTFALRLASPFASPILDLYARLSPDGDRRLLGRPEFKAMFLDDLLNGSRRQMSAPLADVLLFTRDWGFALSDVKVPVLWWHGDADHIVPFAHGAHVVDRLPDARLTVLHGESHLGGLGVALEVLPALRALWEER